MLKDFFTPKFLFEINRIQIQPADKFFLMVGVAGLVIAVIFKLSAKFSPSPVDTKYRNKLFNVFLFLALGEIFWYGARVQLVRFFGAHFVAILIILIVFIWLILALWKMFRNYRGEKTAWEKEQVKLKYLPG
ncbi:MAG: hypothetical protein HYZ51_03230 [Candidatus Doudnabacteria bacterium]|nr:hypothetical protein [Candidatus Doudnabacteria bacterium]